ncbi:MULTISPECIES: Bug family tripartite tricarboxylate transporter substrate binding protein [Rhodococcus]|uniref:Bug family tripartite tricarboxylate transporter substrate binding protein n=1 Tax=Rhodococcus TaxID=1827 RepID=UPI00211A31DF|nr:MULTISPECIES: tripartite tricarboxylate transporter substrate-binding protein [Rhodococcus]
MRTSKRLSRHIALLGACAMALVLSTGCTPVESFFAGGRAGETSEELRVLVPSVAGGGYDLTARTMVQALADEGTVDADVVVLPGSGGIVGLNRLALERGNPDLLMVMGLGVLGSLEILPSEHTLSDVTPIARLVEEPEAVLVPADSPYKTLADLTQSWVADPSSISIGGGSSEGGPDGLFRLLFARAVGVDPSLSPYRIYDGGGELLPALLTRQVDVAATGIGEYLDQIAAGTVRVLAVSSPERTPAVDAPTMAESGVDVTFTNWRGLMAPPGLSDDQRQHLQNLVRDLAASPRWNELSDRNGWNSAVLTEPEFSAFLAEQSRFVDATLDPPGTN